MATPTYTHPAAPGQSAIAVTPSDTVNIASNNMPTKGIYVGGTGNVALLMPDNTTATLTAVPVGAFLPIGVLRIKATGTTATNIVAFF